MENTCTSNQSDYVCKDVEQQSTISVNISSIGSIDWTGWSFPRLNEQRKAYGIHTYSQINTQFIRLHHILRRRTRDGKYIYKVRICKYCRGTEESLDIGSFSDLESAILANDVHEKLNNRSEHVHILTDEDRVFMDKILVSRSWRNETFDVNIMELLRDRLQRPNEKIDDSDKITVVSSHKKTDPAAALVSKVISAQKQAQTDKRGLFLKLQLHDFRKYFIEGLRCCSLSSELDTIVGAVKEMALSLQDELPSVASDSSLCTEGPLKRLEAIITSAVQCGCISSGSLQLASACAIPGDYDLTALVTSHIRDICGNDPIAATSVVEQMSKDTLSAIYEGASEFVWGTGLQKLFRINHTIALKCELDLHLPLWDSTGDDNFFVGECKIRSACSMMHNQVKSVGMLVDGLLNAQSMKDNLCAYTDGKQPDHAYLEDLTELATSTLVLSLTGLGTAALLMKLFKLSDGFSSDTAPFSVYEVLHARNEFIYQKLTPSSVLQVGLYESVKLDLLTAHIRTMSQSPKPNMPGIFLNSSRLIHILSIGPTESICPKGDIEECLNSATASSILILNMLKRLRPTRKGKSQNQNDQPYSTKFFGIVSEIRLRVNISLMCLAVATSELSCIGTISINAAVIAAVHRDLSCLCRWMDTTDSVSGIVFAHTLLSLFNCILVEEGLVKLLTDSNTAKTDTLAMQEMVQEISSFAERIIRWFSSRFKLPKMMLALLDSHRACKANRECRDVFSSSNVLNVSVFADISSNNAPVGQKLVHNEPKAPSGVQSVILTQEGCRKRKLELESIDILEVSKMPKLNPQHLQV